MVIHMDEMKCSQCGATIEAGAGICKYCGAVVDQAAAGTQQPPVQQQVPPQQAVPQQPVYGQPVQQPYTPPQQPYYGNAQQVPPQQPYYANPQQPYGQQPVQPPYGVPMQPPYAAPQAMVDPAMQKSKVAAGLLGIFLGVFGVHNFYLGYTGKAVGQRLITLLSCFTLSFVSWVWGLVEGIMILTGSIAVDARNIPMKD